jgi:uncharacterized protein YyaL (SSP411 family)
MRLALISLVPFIAAVSLRGRACSSLLPSTYLSTAFSATRAQVDSYAKDSHVALLKTTDARNGNFKGSGGFWTSQNGWLNVAAYDKTRGTQLFAAQVSDAQDALARGTGPGTPLVNEFNDDAGWAALANLRAYEAYGDGKYLDRAVAVWKVSSESLNVDETVPRHTVHRPEGH